MAVPADTTPLKAFRMAFGVGKNKVSQEKLARLADTSLQTYRSAEGGEQIYLSTAIAIWRALNSERAARGLEPVSLERLWFIAE